MSILEANDHLPLSISLDSSTPLYDQIESQLRQLIVTDVITTGSPLPSVRALAAHLGCSVITTRRAYQELEMQGLIRTLQGRGTIVADISEELRKEYRLAPVTHALRVAIQEARSIGLSQAELQRLFDSAMGKDE